MIGGAAAVLKYGASAPTKDIHLFGDAEGERVALRWGVAVPRIKKR